MYCLNCKMECKSKFCSRSCAASFNNKIYVKRKPIHHCKYCNKLVNSKHRYCSAICRKSIRDIEKSKRISIKESNFKAKSNVKAVISWRQKIKIKAIQLMGGCCKLCGYNKCVRSLQFHHIDPSQKEFGISAKTKSWERVKEELSKCILVCANCHGEIHEGKIKL